MRSGAGLSLHPEILPRTDAPDDPNPQPCRPRPRGTRIAPKSPMSAPECTLPCISRISNTVANVSEQSRVMPILLIRDSATDSKHQRSKDRVRHQIIVCVSPGRLPFSLQKKQSLLTPRSSQRLDEWQALTAPYLIGTNTTNYPTPISLFLY